jgi:exopolysaccharide production protein ExoZ
MDYSSRDRSAWLHLTKKHTSSWQVATTSQVTTVEAAQPRARGVEGLRELFGIQMLRGVAATMVVFHHSLEESLGAKVGPMSPDWLTTFGAAGVDIFFVISGFIMLYVSFPPDRSPILAREFLERRVTRIYPLYWVFCSLVVLLTMFGLLKSVAVTPSTLVASIVIFPMPDRLIGVSWTLSYEIYFYLIFSLSLNLRSQLASTALCTGIITFALVTANLAPGTLLDFFRQPIALEFCFGLLVALAYMRWRSGIRISMKLSLVGFMALAFSPLIIFHLSTNGLVGFSRLLAWGMPSTLIVLCFLYIGKPRNTIENVAAFPGDASYSIYISHFLVMICYAKLLKSTGLADIWQAPVVPLVVLLCIAVGAATFLFVERPLIKLTRVMAG